MKRCFTDPRYWKNPALRRSREKLVGGNEIRKVNFCLKVDLFLWGIWSWRFFVKTKACVARNFSWWIFRTFCFFFLFRGMFWLFKTKPNAHMDTGEIYVPSRTSSKVGGVEFFVSLEPWECVSWAPLAWSNGCVAHYVRKKRIWRSRFVCANSGLLFFIALVWRLDWFSARNICNSRIPSTNCGHVNAFEFDRALVNSRANFERTRGMNGWCMTVAVRKVQVFFGVFVSSEQTYSSTNMRDPVSRNFVGPRLQTWQNGKLHKQQTKQPGLMIKHRKSYKQI